MHNKFRLSVWDFQLKCESEFHPSIQKGHPSDRESKNETIAGYCIKISVFN